MGIQSQVIERAVADLRPYARNARVHSKKQIKQIAASIERFGFVNPVLVSDDGEIIAGHGRVEAARLLAMKTVPCLALSHLTPAERRAYVLADNKLALNAGWDPEILAIELQGLIDLDFDTELTGFSIAEIDLALDRAADADPAAGDTPEDVVTVAAGPPVSRMGDMWLLGRHRLLCGDARNGADFATLMGEDRADIVFTDPPYNVKIEGNVTGLGKVKHREFAFASGEMSKREFTTFLATTLSYGKPPAKSQFKAGQSGNPHGSSKKRRALKADANSSALDHILLKEANRKIAINENGVLSEITTEEAIVKKMVIGAVKGDRASQKEYLDRTDRARERLHKDRLARFSLLVQFVNERASARALGSISSALPVWPDPADVVINYHDCTGEVMGPVDAQQAEPFFELIGDYRIWKARLAQLRIMAGQATGHMQTSYPTPINVIIKLLATISHYLPPSFKDRLQWDDGPTRRRRGQADRNDRGIKSA